MNALAVAGPLVYLGGDFSGANSVNGSKQRDHAAAVDATTGTATGWDPAPNGIVRAILPSGPTIYLGGDFATVNGATTRNGAAAVDATSGVATAWDPALTRPVLAPSVAALTAASGSIYLGGELRDRPGRRTRRDSPRSIRRAVPRPPGRPTHSAG